MATRREFLGTEDEEKTLSAPTMTRSRGQLGSAYAPGAFFTFEGGLGACISLPDFSAKDDDAPIHAVTKAQIILRLQEVWQSWFTRAYAVGTEIDKSTRASAWTKHFLRALPSFHWERTDWRS